MNLYNLHPLIISGGHDIVSPPRCLCYVHMWFCMVFTVQLLMLDGGVQWTIVMYWGGLYLNLKNVERFFKGSNLWMGITAKSLHSYFFWRCSCICLNIWIVFDAFCPNVSLLFHTVFIYAKTCSFLFYLTLVYYYLHSSYSSIFICRSFIGSVNDVATSSTEDEFVQVECCSISQGLQGLK